TQPVSGGNKNQFSSLQGVGCRDSNAVGVGSVCLTVTIKAKGRNDRDDTLTQQHLKKFCVDTLDLPGEQLVNALDDSHRMRDDGIRASGAQVIGRKTFENIVRDTIRGIYRQLQGWGIGHAGTVEVGSRDMLLLSESSNLPGCAVHKHYTNIQ